MCARVKILKKDLEKIFGKILENRKNLTNIARRIDVHPRTLNDWKNGRATIPEISFDKLLAIAKLHKRNVVFRKLPEFWHIKIAAKKGACRRFKLYGDFGTPEGRRMGGINSIKAHQKNNDGFKTLKSIKKPKNSEKLAEFLGILIGDGHLSEYQASVTTNSITDMEHALFIKKLTEELFGVRATIKIKKEENAVNVVASSKNLVEFLNKKGMPIGNKIKNDLCIPSWIGKSEIYIKSFLRGLFDTDGCVYVDTHRIRGKTYRHFGWTITSYASKLLSDIVAILRRLGFTPTNRKTQKSVFLRRQKEISRYFDEIGTSNLKHYRRYFGRVPKWS